MAERIPSTPQYREGRACAALGAPMADNPYQPSTWRWLAWQRGYRSSAFVDLEQGPHVLYEATGGLGRVIQLSLRL